MLLLWRWQSCFQAIYILLCLNITAIYCKFTPTFQDQKSQVLERQLVYLHNPHHTSGESERSRRSFHNKNIGSKNLPNNIYYELEAFKHTFHINFTLDSSFIAPYFIVQKENSSWIDVPNSLLRGLSNSSSAANSSTRYDGCYYTGIVNDDRLSPGVANLCNSSGMIGSFLHGEHEYYIEPVSSDEDGAHSMFRRSVKGRRSHSSCATDTSERKVTDLYKRADRQLSSSPSVEAVQSANRTRRSVSREHTVELMIVADSAMVLFHGDGLEQYLLSLVAVASRIYKDGSLGNLVNLVLVKVRIITDVKKGPNITHDAQQALSNFCEWQHQENELDDAHPYHHDTAVLLTRVNICRSEGKCGTLGLAELGTVCDPKRSCAIIEDNGLSSAFTIAHEIGHVFGVPHDDSGTCTKTELNGDTVRRNTYSENQYHLMSSTLDYNSKTWSWSACSRQFMTKFLDIDNNVRCLQDKPTPPLDYQKKLDVYIVSEPGQSYDKNAQCEMVYGKGARICPYMPVCKRLWCTLPDNNGCRTQHMPWADGTECGRDKWCIRGNCEAKSLHPQPVDGQWGLWDNWTHCSRTCGGGIKYSERMCDNPSPQSGGKFCLGRRTRYRSCNTRPCPAGFPNYRERQCEQYNGRKFNHEEIPSNAQYMPYYSDVASEQCKLYCSVKGIKPNYYKISNKVEDGTRCTRDSTDICVGGVCMPAGCDNTLGSNLSKDMCGVCGGDNSTCRLSTFANRTYTTGTMLYGYNKVTTLPVNASSIVISQRSLQDDHIDENYLAVRDSTGNYLFNGQYIVMMYSLEVKLKNGATIEFSGSEQLEERISINSFIAEELTIEVLSVGSLQPANVYYRYVLPIEGKVTFQWAINDSWTQCNNECRGKRSQQLSCIREQDNLHVNMSHCADKKKPAVREEWCNLHCDIRWKTESIEDCSANCGRGFIKRKVTCVKRSRAGLKTVSEDQCKAPRPSNIEACSGRCSPTLWRFSDWKNCSAACGGGTQTRDAICTLRNGRRIVDFACNREAKLVSRSCNTHDCTQYDMRDWGQCSASCGRGMQTRVVTCLEAGQHADLSRCGPNPPPSSQPCQLRTCPIWHTSDWTDCSVTCGQGFRYREVKCVEGPNGDELKDEYCAAETQPTELMNCTRVACPGWVASNWSACSVTCGDIGTKQRSVECKDHQGSLVPVHFCQIDTKPEMTADCFPQASCSQGLHRVFSIFGLQNKKEYMWRYGGWAPCSTTCGGGVRQRFVKCSAQSNPEVQVPDSNCRKQRKPDDEQPCRQAACGVWRTGLWGQCTKSCGEGTQSRVVVCALPNGKFGQPADCDILQIPDKERPCEGQDCPSPAPTTPVTVVTSYVSNDEIAQTEAPSTNYWRAGAWTKCSKSCAGGLRRRAVGCYKGYSKSTGCNADDRPSHKEECNTQACPTWRKGGWTKCSSDCGYGTQQRMVVCQLYDKSAGHAKLCGGQTPTSRQDCLIKPCGIPVWNTTKWSACSASCGAGDMTRIVNCVDTANTSLVLAANMCSPEAKPSSMEMCIQTECSRWQESEWTKCTGPCGASRRTRTVWCKSLSGRELADERCSAAPKPTSREVCKQERCNYQWKTVEWSKCSVSCGKGMRTRDITCRATNGTKVAASNCATWPQPSRSERCNNGECPVWKVSPWDQCSVTCGYGQQLRLVECFNTSTNTTVESARCDINSKPVEITICQAGPCPSWKAYKWSKCSGRCNASTSVQTRVVQCLSAKTREALSANMCSKSKQPSSTRRCQDCSSWKADKWSRCSETCGSGIQARKLYCIGSDGSERPEEDCSNEPRPKLIQSCKATPCAFWHASPWSQCSVSCTKGYRTRRVSCLDGVTREPIFSSRCKESSQPIEQEGCIVHELCPAWSFSAWSSCSQSCGTGIKHRNVTCATTKEAVHNSFCDQQTKPKTIDSCSSSSCHSGFEWKSEKWSGCSASCGEGRQFRKVLCKSVSREGWYVGNSGFGCSIDKKPPAIRTCTRGPCYSSYIWRPDSWGKCSAECGWGNERRKVLCVRDSGERVPRSKCNSIFKPERSQKCYAGPCRAQSCSELRRKSSIREDGDYKIFIKDKSVKIYCHRMYSKEPKEYITLSAGPNENYALIYGHRLAHPYVCPYTTNMIESQAGCKNCVSSPYHRAGETRFSKVRLNITDLSVIVTDFQFSATSGRNRISYASAGDCYSALNCPQGQFSVNLKGTGFKVASQAKWRLEGSYSYKEINRHDTGELVQGRCGGYCGLCVPTVHNRLKLDLVDGT